MKKKLARLTILLSAIVVLVNSCTKNSQNSDIDHAKQVYAYIKSLGYKETSIVDDGANYIVEGDMFYSKDMVLPTRPANPTEQYYNGTLVNLAHQVIQVRLDASLSLSSELDAALTLWNNSHSWVIFQRVTSGGQILVQNASLAAYGYCGVSGPPSSGLPYPTVNVDGVLLATYTTAKKVAAIAHELGHCIGFRHSDGDAGVFGTPVPGWGGTDASSIMIKLICGSGNTSLSTNDINAVNALYPNPYPKNPSIDVSYSQFNIKWTAPTPNPSDAITGYQLDYSYNLGSGGGGSASGVSLSIGTTNYIIPGANSNPSGAPSGYVTATIKAVYASGTICAAPTVTRFRSGGVWN